VAGFIGSNLREALLKLNQRVVGLDNFATGHQRNLDEAQTLVTPPSGKTSTSFQATSPTWKIATASWSSPLHPAGHVIPLSLPPGGGQG
jgi:hypothetical protein